MEFIEIHKASIKWNIAVNQIIALCRAGIIIVTKKVGNLWMIPDCAPKPCGNKIEEYSAQHQTQNLIIPSTPLCSEGSNDMKAVRAFEQIYTHSPKSIAFTPYRICPIGAHSDHQLGKITGFAISKGIHIAYGPKQNGVIEISSLQFTKRAQWHVNGTPPEKQDDWADHLRGATIALNSRYPLHIGLCAIVDGELPIGGLSSSAAIIITFLSALCHLNNIQLSSKELIAISMEAENKYVGVACGKLDQSCEIYSKKNHLLYMDLRDDSYELIPISATMKPFEIAIFFSGLERSLASSNLI